MNYRTLGRTGLKVPEVGFGCGNVGGLMVRGSLEEQVHAVQRALDMGVDYFDTAPGYGDGLSETNLGLVLKKLKPQVHVATKVHVRDDGLKDIRGTVRRSIEDSLRRLDCDSVDLLQLHTQVVMERGGGDRSEALSLHDVLGNDGVADAFDDLRSEGLIGFLGLTGAGDADALHQVVDSGRFDTIQAHYNLLNPSAGVAVPPGFATYDFHQLIDHAAQKGMGVVVIRVMAAGALAGPAARTGRASPSVGGALVAGGDYDTEIERADTLDFLVSGDVGSRAQAAVRFALMHPGVSTVLVGISGVSQLEEAAACSGKEPLPEEAISRLKDLWASDFGRR